jgi:hypothetical protein
MYASDGSDFIVNTQNVLLKNLKITKTATGANLLLETLSLKSDTATVSVDELSGSVGYKKDAKGEIQFDFVKLDKAQITATTGNYIAVGTLTVPKYLINKSLAPRGGFEETTVEKQNCYNYYNGYTMVDNCYTWEDTNTMLGNSGYLPAQIVFEGSFKNTETLGEIKGKIDVQLRNVEDINITGLVDNGEIENFIDNEMNLKVSINGTLLMPDRPDTLVNLGYETKVDDDAHRHSFTGSYQYDSTMITLEGTLSKDRNNIALTFTSASGLEATFIKEGDNFINGDRAKATGSLISKDGKVIAVIEDINDVIRIKYADGSFESIF